MYYIQLAIQISIESMSELAEAESRMLAIEGKLLALQVSCDDRTNTTGSSEILLGDYMIYKMM